MLHRGYYVLLANSLGIIEEYNITSTLIRRENVELQYKQIY